MFFLMTDQDRLPDPTALLSRLPRGAAVIVRHTEDRARAALARRILPSAHRLGLKVLYAGDVRTALRLGCDGVHLSEAAARRGPPRVRSPHRAFLITAAAHDRLGLWHAARAGANMIFLSPVFATRSHPNARPWGPLRFARLARTNPRAVVALGGISHENSRRLALGPAYGLAAIEAWTR